MPLLDRPAALLAVSMASYMLLPQPFATASLLYLTAQFMVSTLAPAFPTSN
jgi:hypothetical protein